MFRSHTYLSFHDSALQRPPGQGAGARGWTCVWAGQVHKEGKSLFFNHLCGFIIQFHFLPLMSHFLQGSVPAPKAISLLSVLSFSKPDKESQVSCLDPCKELLQTSSDQKSAVVSFPLRNWCRRWHSITLLSFLWLLHFFLSPHPLCSAILGGVMQMSCFWLGIQRLLILITLTVVSFCINCCPLKKETALIRIF